MIIGENGKFHHLIKTSRKRRERRGIKEINERIEARKTEEAAQKDREIARLQDMLRNFEEVKTQNDINAEKLNELFQAEVIDLDGKLTPGFKSRNSMG